MHALYDACRLNRGVKANWWDIRKMISQNTLHFSTQSWPLAFASLMDERFIFPRSPNNVTVFHRIHRLGWKNRESNRFTYFQVAYICTGTLIAWSISVITSLHIHYIIRLWWNAARGSMGERHGEFSEYPHCLCKKKYILFQVGLFYMNENRGRVRTVFYDLSLSVSVL